MGHLGKVFTFTEKYWGAYGANSSFCVFYTAEAPIGHLGKVFTFTEKYWVALTEQIDPLGFSTQRQPQ